MQALVRVGSDEEAVLLEREPHTRAFVGELELAAGMTRQVLERIATGGAPPPAH
jgi:hypothetical protein